RPAQRQAAQPKMPKPVGQLRQPVAPLVYRPAQQQAAQLKTPNRAVASPKPAGQSARKPVAPPVYRPAQPQAAQLKTPNRTVVPKPVGQPRRPVAPPVYRPAQQQQTAQAKMLKPPAPKTSRAASAGTQIQRVKMPSGGVIQRNQKNRETDREKLKLVNAAQLEQNWFGEKARPSVDGVTLHDWSNSFPEFDVEIDNKQVIKKGHFNFKEGFSLAHLTFSYDGGALTNYWYGIDTDGDLVLDNSRWPEKKKTSLTFSQIPSDVKSVLENLLITLYDGT
ncbi:MAG: hypothetical protein M3379_16145, partial [Acidobacteriota bacterium]|nr:hypothetical protein [Acidobacteriota bacterium]